MMEQMKRGGVGISPTNMERKNDDPFRTCVYIGAMLATAKQRRKTPVKTVDKQMRNINKGDIIML